MKKDVDRQISPILNFYAFDVFLRIEGLPVVKNPDFFLKTWFFVDRKRKIMQYK